MVLGAVFLAEILVVAGVVGDALNALLCPKGAGFFGGPPCSVPGGFTVVLGGELVAVVIQLVLLMGVVSRVSLALRATLALQPVFVVGIVLMVPSALAAAAVSLLVPALFVAVLLLNKGLRHTGKDSKEA